MNRSALIIGSPDADIPGVKQDMVAYRQHFESQLGGAWYPHEIETLESPGDLVVRQKLEMMKKADYSVVVFAGHGSHPTRTGTTKVLLRPGVEMDVNILKLGAPKHTLIVDCCRKLNRQIILDSVMAKSASFSEARSMVDYRRYFDLAVQNCSTGLVTLFSCDIDETAQDLSTGGLYSVELLAYARQWEEQRNRGSGESHRVLQIPDAHEAAKVKVIIASGGRQTPQIEKPRSSPYFPFAISA
ncbi:caspase family protein [Polaromonas sp.]|uniref:caspase family protein n=1 Tax=Polaromonas sp. TaxID=1869339 RepID=UPI0037527B52